MLGVWFPLMCASFFGMAYFSSRICRALCINVTYLEGWVALLPIVPTILASNMSTALSMGNVSPFLGFLISWVTYAWLSNRQVSISFGIIPLILFKGIGLSWCPLLLLKPIKWRTLGGMALLTALLNGITLYCGGIEVYRTFFVDILPKANIALGIGLQGLLLKFLGLEFSLGSSILQVVLISILYWGFWRQYQSNTPSHRPVAIVATMAGTLAVFCLCNKIVWPHHYYSSYLMLPFSGWILWEGCQAGRIWQKLIFGMFALSLLFWLDSIFLLKDSWFMECLKDHGFYNARIGQARSAVNGLIVFLLPALEFAFLLALAYRRLFFAHAESAQTPVESLPNVAASSSPILPQIS